MAYFAFSRFGRKGGKRARGEVSIGYTNVCVCVSVRSCVWRGTVRRCKCNSRRGLVVSSPRDISPLLSVKLSLFQPCLVFVPPWSEDRHIFEPRGPAFPSPLRFRLLVRFFFFPFPFCLFAPCLFLPLPPLSLSFYIYIPSSREQDLGGVGPTSPLY